MDLLISTAGSRRHAYFDGFQIIAVSTIAKFSIRFCCFVFNVKQLLKVNSVVYCVMATMGTNK